MSASRDQAVLKIALKGLAILAVFALAGFLVFAGGAILLAFAVTSKREQYTSLRSVSPDGQQLAEIYETPEGGFPSDRQFQIILSQATNTNKHHVLFHSPDEGAEGTERIVWSADSRYFLLLGAEFCVETNAPLNEVNAYGGVYGYFLYDTAQGKAFCNSAQLRKGSYARFYISDLSGKNFDSRVLQAAVTDAQKEGQRRRR